jgi:hypothetical protein
MSVMDGVCHISLISGVRHSSLLCPMILVLSPSLPSATCSAFTKSSNAVLIAARSSPAGYGLPLKGVAEAVRLDALHQILAGVAFRAQPIEDVGLEGAREQFGRAVPVVAGLAGELLAPRGSSRSRRASCRHLALFLRPQRSSSRRRSASRPSSTARSAAGIALALAHQVAHPLGLVLPALEPARAVLLHAFGAPPPDRRSPACSAAPA